MFQRVPFQGVEAYVDRIGPYLEVLALLVASFLFVYLIGRILVLPAAASLARSRNEKNPTLVQAIERYIHLTIVAAAGIVAVIVAGFGHVLTGSALVIAAVTLAIGVAGQAVIGNLVSGLFLVVDPDFNVDDWIEWDDGAGVVETIRFRVTRVRTPANEVITVPNTTLATTAVTRPYSRDRFRIVVRFGVAYEDDLDVVTAAVRTELERGGRILETPPPAVMVEELGDSGVWFLVQFWIGTPTHGAVMQAREAFIRRAKRRLEREGVTISPPAEHELSGTLRIDR